MNTIETSSLLAEAVQIIDTPLLVDVDAYRVPLTFSSLVEEAVRAIVDDVPNKCFVEHAPGGLSLAHLLRVFVEAENRGLWPSARYLHQQLTTVERRMQESSGDVKTAYLQIGRIFGHALEKLGVADAKEYCVPHIFRL